MKTLSAVLVASTVAVISSQAVAQSQDDQQACEGDVYALCQDKIPDQDAIVVCLRKHWSKVSKECRHVMATYGKNQKHKVRGGTSGMRNGSRY